ncbi:MAG: rRNA pseudouridine synthase [Cyanobacteria bacterium]|nr:rRNA pseudouridine synthase [Cyanobacteria bacterium bin.51]
MAAERERIQKLLASAGLCSRRHAEQLMREGRVRVNGVVAQLGDRADARVDRVEVDNQPLPNPAGSLTVLLNKPAGVVCSCHDPEGRTTVLDLLPLELTERTGLHPIGRLDAHSRGALLLTNDGALTLQLSHPRYSHSKTYHLCLRGQPDRACLDRWRQGIPLDGQPSRPVAVRVLNSPCSNSDHTWLELRMREGRNRQIRRTAALLGFPVLDLQRVAIGALSLGDLPEGRWRHLSGQEWLDHA